VRARARTKVEKEDEKFLARERESEYRRAEEGTEDWNIAVCPHRAHDAWTAGGGRGGGDNSGPIE